jgi:Carboxypeptidase regulatory-like domain
VVRVVPKILTTKHFEAEKTMRIDFFPQRSARLGSWFLLMLLLSALAVSLSAQTTISTGSIQGTVSDPSGALVSGAKVSIRNKGTNQTVATSTNTSGAYASGALIPGEYVVRVEAAGFKTMELPVTVQVNTTTSGNVKLVVGESTQVVEVQASAVTVNTEQATVQGILTTQQIQNLPINGRNFLDLAQLEPGVQIQDGGTFDPTKNGFSSVSFGGRFGRTARIEVDGVDISDETVGTTTANIPLGAIQEASLQQSSLDLSTELTSSGSVNVNTQPGTNALHGTGFYYFRDQVLNAALPGGSTNPFQRNQFGGSLGGPILKDKLFFFFDAERNKQDLLDPVLPGGAFTDLTGSFTSPFRETQTVGRLDWQASRFKIFYRFSFDQNKSVLPFIPNSFQPFANVNHSRAHVVGVDFGTGNFTHSIRFGYTKFQNGIADAVTGSSIFDPAPGIELAIGGDPFCLTAGADDFCSGPNFLAPQATVQSDHQIKYDASKTYKSHIFRFGVGYNHLHGGGFAEFLGLAPAVGSPSLAPGSQPPCAPDCPFPGPPSDPTNFAANPLNYPATDVTLGNGQGFSSEFRAFGFPGGGLGPDDRFSWYVGDSWKLKPNFTLTMGLRYVRDTGRTDSDIGHVAPLDQFNNQFYKGLGNPVRQPNNSFAPQLGFAWDPKSNGKTVVRGGIGLFYENSIWNNNLFDRPARLQKGLFLGFSGACSGGTGSFSFCGQPIGNVASQIIQAQQAFQAATVAAGPATNSSYIGNALAAAIDLTSTEMFAPNYRTPRSVQMNIGIQREIRPGMVFTVDYLRNVATHNLLAVDTNHIGDARFFNLTAAQNAIAATLSACGQPTIDLAIAAGTCPATPFNPAVHTATIADFASVKFDSSGTPISGGLDSGYSSFSGLPGAFTCDPSGTTCLTPDTGAAFPGINPNVGANQMLFPIGRSVYNGLQATLKQDVHNPLPGVKYLNLQVSYAFSRYVSTARDNDFINFSQDYANPLRYIGPNGLDRTHQISFGGTMDLPAGFRLSVISHFDSPLPSRLTLPVSGLPGGIFQTDLTGDGTGDGSVVSNGGVGDLLPGTNIGSFGRDFGVGGLNQKIANFNNTMVGQPTPAGQVLISNNLFTLTQLQELGGVIGGGTGPLQLAPPGAIGQAWLKTFDLSLSWAYKIRERFEIRPGVSFFNLFNFANFDGPAAPFSDILDGSQGSPNGTTKQPDNLRLGLGSGVNALGSPRVIEFSLKIAF